MRKVIRYKKGDIVGRKLKESTLLRDWVAIEERDVQAYSGTKGFLLALLWLPLALFGSRSYIDVTYEKKGNSTAHTPEMGSAILTSGKQMQSPGSAHSDSIKAPWYSETWIIILSLVIFFPVGVFLMWRFAQWSQKVKIAITIVGLLVFLVGRSNSPEQSKLPANSVKSIVSPTVNEVTPTEVPTTTPLSNYKYQILEREKLKLVENIFVLVDPDEKDAEAIAWILHKTCQREGCNVNVFDDKRAYELDRAYSKSLDPAYRQKWETDNYVYVADHLVGTIFFDAKLYKSYPMKDWLYKKLKGQ